MGKFDFVLFFRVQKLAVTPDPTISAESELLIYLEVVFQALVSITLFRAEFSSYLNRRWPFQPNQLTALIPASSKT